MDAAENQKHPFSSQHVAMQNAQGITYLHSDHLASTNATSGAVTTSGVVYFPFGSPRAGNLPTDYTYTGQKFDASDSLMYYGARYYDAALGRFISADTIVPSAGNPQALNRYAYTLNNPLRYMDPSGHRACGNADEVDCNESVGEPGRWEAPLPIDDTCNSARCSDDSAYRYVYSADVELALARAWKSPTARPFITWVRYHHVNFVFNSVLSDYIQIRLKEGAITQGNTINLDPIFESSAKLLGGTNDQQLPNYYEQSGKPIPPDLIIHEIVHVMQNFRDGQGTWCGCSLEREREAYTVGDTVAHELNTDPSKEVSAWTDPRTAARIEGGIYNAQPWTDQDYEAFKQRLGDAYWFFPIR